MLEMVDKFLCLFVPAIIYIIFIAASIVGFVACISLWFSNSPMKEKLNILGACLIIFSVTIFFFAWVYDNPWTEEDVASAALSNPDFPDYSWVPVVVAGFFALITLLIPLILRACGIPLIICGIVYMGICIFGL